MKTMENNVVFNEVAVRNLLLEFSEINLRSRQNSGSYKVLLHILLIFNSFTLESKKIFYNDFTALVKEILYDTILFEWSMEDKFIDNCEGISSFMRKEIEGHV